ncbi:MAG TPA: VOC family protein [Gemmatimonadaceae bacterium]|nr:VOC family protein [Gemmatimonadaceae bacterium]
MKTSQTKGIAGSTAETPTPRNDLPYGIAPKKYRLPDDTRLGPVRLQVADLARSLEYYQQVLGLRVVAQSTGRASLAAQGDDTVLIELHELPGAHAVPRRGRLGLYHYAILLPDRASLGRFVAHLSSIGAYAGMSDHLVSEALYLTDPDGLGIEVYSDRDRSTWKYEGRQLAMATDPLDVQSLVDAAGDVPWSGMPAGTKIGHVHLHVADIPEAEAFYHGGLGFDKMVWSYPGALFLAAGGYHHHLGTNTWATGAPRSEENDARLLEWTVVVPTPADAAAAAQSLEAGGYSVHADADRQSWRTADPWGTPLRIAPAESVS